MLIIESKKALFVHIEKCGGTAVEFGLDKHLEIFDVRIGGTEFGEEVQAAYRKRFNLHKHSKGWEIRKAISTERYNEYFTFALVRNPLSRVVSAYRYLRSGTWDFELAHRVKQMSSIKEFIASNDFAWIRPCYEYVYDMKGEKCVDFIGKIENLREDFAYICGRLGIEKVDLPKANVSSADDSPVLLKEEILSDRFCVDRINEKFNRDFNLLGYTPLELKK